MAMLDSAPPEEADSAPPEPAPVAEAAPAGDEVAKVKRDFAKLFEPETPEAPREAAPVVAEKKAEAAPPQEASQDALSSEELDALLSESMGSVKAEAPAAEKTPATPVAVPEELLADSDGVLEAELRQLMPEAPGETLLTPPAELPEAGAKETPVMEAHPLPEIPAAPANTFTPPAELPETPRPAAVIIKGDDEETEPKVEAAAKPATAAPVAAAAPASPAAAPAAAPAPAAAAMPIAPAGMSAPPVVVVELPEKADPVDDSPRSNLLTDVLVMIGQLIDMPFAWISNDTRYLIGLAAFLLFAGAAILFVIHRMIG
jgi:hypothetical protein